MGIREVASVLKDVPVLLALKKGMQPRPLDEKDCLGAVVERTAENFGTLSAVVCEGETVTWGELNAHANRYAHFLKGAGLRAGDTVSIMMENRIEFLALLIATNKLGITAGLINTNLRGRPLIHCVNVTESKKCVFGGEVQDAIEEARGELNLEQGSDYFVVPDGTSNGSPDWAINMAAGSANLAVENPDDTGEMTLGQTAMYIFTSGTTGLPKAAVMSNRRYLMTAGLSATAGLRCTSADRIYICLPLYHGTALMVGAGAAFMSGASMFLRRRFSSSGFLPDAREHGCTSFIYVGELCRYLNNSEPKPDDHDNPLHTMMGNGLRPDIWVDFKRRYGIRRVTEFYGASEGNVAFANLMNKDCTIGMTSSKIALVRYDVDSDEIVRGDDGRCIEVAQGEPGLLLGHINPTARFEGYTDPEATESKILRGVLEEGDAWFNTGDLIREVDVGFSLGYAHYQFVDRTGDTFRWKSENVSTNEVGEIINGFEGIEFCNVYGVEVPGADGRAGMAAVRLAEGHDLDLAGLASYVERELPPYARPVFVRVQSEIEVTGTFKMVKGDLKQEGFDISSFDDPVYVMKPGSASYEALDANYLATIRDGAAGF
ncbi:MAG: long-chain-acyl-CoA synthetase [Gammaproteobacteria bacterium]|nr:long-chain-acyl-CoA synthetase [Gammaproteobacteria bacterium]